MDTLLVPRTPPNPASLSSSTPDGGVSSSTLDGGVSSSPPDGGVSSSPPDGGVSSSPPDGGVSSSTPDGGVSSSPPDGGVSSSPPDGGVSSSPPDGGVGNGMEGACTPTIDKGLVVVTAQPLQDSATPPSKRIRLTTDVGSYFSPLTDEEDGKWPNGADAWNSAGYKEIVERTGIEFKRVQQYRNIGGKTLTLTLDGQKTIVAGLNQVWMWSELDFGPCALSFYNNLPYTVCFKHDRLFVKNCVYKHFNSSVDDHVIAGVYQSPCPINNLSVTAVNHTVWLLANSQAGFEVVAGNDSLY
jgi:hypothetical protein